MYVCFDLLLKLCLLSIQFTSLQKEIDDYKAEIQRQHNENNKLQGVIKSLEKDIYGLKKEIQERDETIQDKVKKKWKPGIEEGSCRHSCTHAHTKKNIDSRKTSKL